MTSDHALVGHLLLQIIFYCFATIAIICATLVTLSKNPIHSILSLVFTFFCTAAIWIMLQATFLGLVLILVYIGAVMTLFLFVVMMLNLDDHRQQKKLVRFWPIALLLNIAIFAVLVCSFSFFNHETNFHWLIAKSSIFNPNYSSIKALGRQLYTTYVLPFELVGILLLVGMIAAIALTKQQKNKSKQNQIIHKQVQTQANDRLRIVTDKELKQS